LQHQYHTLHSHVVVDMLTNECNTKLPKAKSKTKLTVTLTEHPLMLVFVLRTVYTNIYQSVTDFPAEIVTHNEKNHVQCVTEIYCKILSFCMPFICNF